MVITTVVEAGKGDKDDRLTEGLMDGNAGIHVVKVGESVARSDAI